jgi:hypothetical protein
VSIISNLRFRWQFELVPRLTMQSSCPPSLNGPPTESRIVQQRPFSPPHAWDRALRRDECGAWCIFGKRGSIHTWGDGNTWVLFVAARSRRHWAATKVRLSFCGVTQDGDEEGCLRLHQLPSPEQAAAIRDALGIRKKMEFASDDLERRRASMTRLSPAPRSAKATAPVPEPIFKKASIPEQEPTFSSKH